jgi:hypothetical protein
VALVVVAEAVDHPGHHVVDRHVGRQRRAAGGQRLEHDHGVQARQPRTADVVADPHAAEAERRGAAQHVDGEVLVAVPLDRAGR